MPDRPTKLSTRGWFPSIATNHTDGRSKHVVGNLQSTHGLPDGRRLLDERKEPMAEELRIQAIDLAKVLHGMQAHQPVTVTGLNDWGIVQVVSGLVCEDQTQTR